jgi:site-specific recombinase XerD
MSAIRGLFDVLVQRHVMILNPALSVRTERYSVAEGKTPEITVEQSRHLLKSIELQSAIDFRDRAIISTLVYTAARVGAIAKLRLGDLVDEGNHLMIRFREKGGKDRSIPARISLREELDEYLAMLPMNCSNKDDPVFRSAIGRTGLLAKSPMSAIDICRMVKRRLKAASLPSSASPHSFRSCTATDLLEQGVSLDAVQSFCLPLNQCSGFVGRGKSGVSVFEDIGRRLRQAVSGTDVRQCRARIRMTCKILEIDDVGSAFACGC